MACYRTHLGRESGQRVHVYVAAYFLRSDLVQLALSEVLHVARPANEVVSRELRLLRVLQCSAAREAGEARHSSTLVAHPTSPCRGLALMARVRGS